MNNLIQAITDYTTALEQKLSALEARVAELEEANEAMKQEGNEAKALIATLQAEVATLAAAGVVATPAEEPEVEIELIIEEEPQEQETPQEPAEEPQEEPAEEPLEIEEPAVAPVVEPSAEPAPQPEVKEEPVVEEKVEETVEKPQPKTAQTIHSSTPIQTSLFGNSVVDIRKAISIGDRFLFQRELFAGNGELMQKTLDELNELGSLSEAMDYVRDNFDWDKESTAVQLFENVLKRRFG